MIPNKLPDFPSDCETSGIKQMVMEYNDEQREFLENKHGMTLKEIYDDSFVSRDLVGLFQCSGCGDFIELSALKHFNFDTKEAKCFKCQNLHFK